MKLIFIKSIKSFLIIPLGILILGCGASKQQAMLDTIDSPQTRPASFEALREDFDRANDDQVHLISPEKYLQAKKSFETAQTMQTQGQPKDEVDKKLIDARKNLDSAMAFAKYNKDALSPLIQAREMALTSGAAETTNKTLKELEGDYVDLVDDLQSKNDREDALNDIPKLTQAYQKLTIKTFQAKYLGEATTNVGLAKSEGAEKAVPKTLRETETIIERAHDFIELNIGTISASKMTELGDEATKASRRLLVLTKQTKSQKGQSPEDISLKAEDNLNSAYEENEEILNSAQAASISESTRLQKNLTEAQEKNVDLENKTENYNELAQKDERNKNFESVRELFNESEAVVYRQGNNLVINLKQINFPVNKSEIPSVSFNLLKKVQEAIRSFDDPSVIVEGHTDSTGDSALNKALSEERAEAVKSYLLSNNVLSQEKISVVGYGSAKPLASNKSSNGRAVNRRIDIVIKD